MTRAIFLDRDGTINADTGFISNPDELVFIRGSKKALKILQDKGFSLFIVTNQSGVARGYFSLTKLKAVHEKLLSELTKEGIRITDVFYCPHHPEDKCKCRKPSPRMVNNAVRKYKISVEKSFFVGDKIIDVQTGKNAGCKTVLLNGGEDLPIENEDDWTQPDYIADNLLDAAKWIIKSLKSKA